MRLSQVYLIGPESGAAVKIGKAVNLADRLSSHQVSSWEKLAVHGAVVIPDSVAKDVERLAHARLKDMKVRGEWYSGDIGHMYYVTLGAARDVIAAVGTKNRLELCNHFCMAGDPEEVVSALSDYMKLRRDKGIEEINSRLLDRVGFSSFAVFTEIVASQRHMDLRSFLINNPKQFDAVEAAIVACLSALVEMKWDLRPQDTADLLKAVFA